ncbi:MAG: hypothetical protein ACC707_08535 [Thiohalomonadales bacterium]
MLFQTRQIISKKKGIISTLLFISMLLIAFSPLVSALIQSNPINPSNIVNNSGSEKAYSEVYSGDARGTVTILADTTAIVSAAVTANPHCLSMAQGKQSCKVVCCPTLVHINSPTIAHPTNETHKVLATVSHYIVTLPTEIKPPKLSFA